MQPRLTVLIPCKNEKLNLRPCVESVRSLASEILVADSGSTDGTLEIARELGCRIIEREYIDSGNFKNWAIPQAENEWVLILDADERLTPELADEIRHLLVAPDFDGYRIYRRNYFLGHEIRYCGWTNDGVLRLFRRDHGRYTDYGDHADVKVRTERVGRLRAKLVHYTYWSLDQYLRKLDRYTMLSSQRWHALGRRATFWQLCFRPPLRFLQLYVYRLGFLDGLPGLVLCWLTAFYSFTKMAKLWALHDGLPQPDPELEHQETLQAA